MNDKRVVKIGRNTNGIYCVGNRKPHQITKNFNFGYGDHLINEYCSQEGIGFYPDIWADNMDDVLKIIWNITGDYEIQR